MGCVPCLSERVLKVRDFTQLCVIPITSGLVMGTGGRQPGSPQRRVNGIQKRSPGEGLFEKRYAAVQHFALGYQFTGVA